MIPNLINHMHWSNSTVIEWISSESALPESFQKLISHILNAEHIWICRALQKEFEFDISKIHTISEMRELNKSNHEKFTSLLHFDMNTIIDYNFFNGTTGKSTLEEILIHAFSHGFHHVGQMSSQASALGKKFPGVSYIAFTRVVK